MNSGLWVEAGLSWGCGCLLPTRVGGTCGLLFVIIMGGRGWYLRSGKVCGAIECDPGRSVVQMTQEFMCFTQCLGSN